MTAYRVELAPAAVRAFKKLPADVRARMQRVLEKLAADAAGTGRVAGKAVKTLHGASDEFHLLRVGDHRVMYGVIAEDRVILVLGIVHRRDLERWLRNR